MMIEKNAKRLQKTDISTSRSMCCFSCQGSRDAPRAVWEITRKCPYECSYCCLEDENFHEIQQQSSINQLIRVLVESEVGEVLFGGREALTRPDILKIVSSLHKSGIRSVISTSGFGFSAELAQKLKDQDVRALNFSLDSINPSVNRISRGGQNSREAIEAIKMAVEANLDVKVSLTITELNKTGIKETLLKLIELGVRRFSLMRKIPLGKSSNWGPLLDGYDRTVNSLRGKYGSVVHLVDPNFVDSSNNCPGGQSLFSIQPDLSIAVCNLAAHMFPTITSKGYSCIHEAIKDSANKLRRLSHAFMARKCVLSELGEIAHC